VDSRKTENKFTGPPYKNVLNNYTGWAKNTPTRKWRYLGNAWIFLY